MTNLTQYGSSELSMQFQNNEQLYKTWLSAIRRNDFDSIKRIASDWFVYTAEQLEELENDFIEEQKEQD